MRSNLKQLLVVFLAACQPPLDAEPPLADVGSVARGVTSSSKPVADSCSPTVLTVYGSCSSALTANATTAGCFAIGTSLAHSPKQCTKTRLLLVQLDNDGLEPAGRAANAEYLNSMIDGLQAYFDESSYGRQVFDVEVAGDKSINRAGRWFVDEQWTKNVPDLTSAWCSGLTDHPLDWYDMIGTLSTRLDESSGSPGSRVTHESNCETHATTTFQVATWTNYGYRELNERDQNAPPTHEPGHALGLLHEQSYSTLAGRGVFAGLNGNLVEYGGRSSTMGGDGRGVSTALNLPQRVALGWLNDGIVGGGRHVTAVSKGSQTVTFNTLESDVEGKKGVYLPTTTGGYWVEARRDAALDSDLQTGLILHHQLTGETYKMQMIDATLDTPTDKPDGLPIGRTYADALNRLYLTAVSETPTTATLQVERDPVNPRSPIITSITMVPVVGDVQRFSVSAVDLDGDPLSYSWRFDDAFSSGATVVRSMAAVKITRVFVTVSDRKGGVATGFIDWPSAPIYAAGWAAPVIDQVTARPITFTSWAVDNEFAFAVTAPTSTEIPSYSWTLGGAPSVWAEAIASYPAVNASAPPCLPYSLTLSDPTNCAAQTSCSTRKFGCAPTPVRLTYNAFAQAATLSYDPALFEGTPDISWSSDDCAISGTGTIVGVDRGCHVRVELTECPGSGARCAKAYAATMQTL